jgi:hypothetical protein
MSDLITRARVSSSSTLGDLKIINSDNTYLWETVGTGTGAFNLNSYGMVVTSGQYLVRRSKQYFPYYSGNVQSIEFTFDGMQNQSGITKRVGYFSSSAVAPYTASFDGLFIEDDGSSTQFSSKWLCIYNAGTEIMRVRQEDWNMRQILDYDWSTFTVMQIDYLWLGGAVAVFSMKVGDDFVALHQFDYPGTSSGTFIKSPSQNVRYEIRSSSGTGSFKAICSRVSTEGSVLDAGILGAITTGSTQILCAAIGTTYPLIGIRKAATARDNIVKVSSLDAGILTNTDIFLLTLQINPILSAPLTYTAVLGSNAEQAVGNGTITVTSPGKVQFTKLIQTATNIGFNLLGEDFLNNIGMTIANVSDQYIVCATPITTTVGAFAAIGFKDL